MKDENMQPSGDKKGYKKPTLTTYGDIQQLTQTAAGDCRDNANAFNNAQPGNGFTCS
ncbi:MAG: hypothetical protein KJN78_04805 [Gammaproteobacteria bacterium]|nr:hypothetical protein [Gammaproteobacteria bacterium]